MICVLLFILLISTLSFDKIIIHSNLNLMKNRLLILIVCWVLVSIGNAAQQVDKKTLIISNAEELIAFAKSVNAGDSYRGKTIKLSNDIWLNDTTGWKNWNRETKIKVWTPIGTAISPFEGIFDGGEHIIAGLFMKAGSENFCQGFFGSLKHAIVKNTHIRFSHMFAYNFVGAIAGYASSNTLIVNCSHGGIIESERNYTGGIVGFSEKFNRFIGCYNLGLVYGHRCVGGIVGYFDSGTIYNCFNRGEIKGKYEHVGGIVGEYNESYYKTITKSAGIEGLQVLPDDTLANCYNTGVIVGRDVVGGIAGYIYLNSDKMSPLKVLFANNYSAGKLFTNYPVVTDGLVGAYMYFADSENFSIPTVDRINRDGDACFWNEESCKIVDIGKPRFESAMIQSDKWNDVCYGIKDIPKTFRYFQPHDMKDERFVDLLNGWVHKKKTSPFKEWSIDLQEVNNGFPVLIND